MSIKRVPTVTIVEISFGGTAHQVEFAGDSYYSQHPLVASSTYYGSSSSDGGFYSTDSCTLIKEVGEFKVTYLRQQYDEFDDENPDYYKTVIIE